jgi:putative toxin-antitoxin system antitoxin component (TIGR02293 family)
MVEKLNLGAAGKSKPKPAQAKRPTTAAKQEAAPASSAPPKGPAKKSRISVEVVFGPSGKSAGHAVPANAIGSADFIHKMRTGEVAKVAIKRVASTLDVSQDVLFTGLRLPKSTMHSRMASGKRLSPLEQDRLYRAERVIERATAVIEDLGEAQRWMQKSIRSLGGATPLSLLDTQAGYDLVMDTLSKIELGVQS